MFSKLRYRLSYGFEFSFFIGQVYFNCSKNKTRSLFLNTNSNPFLKKSLPSRCSNFSSPSRPVMRHAYVDPPQKYGRFPLFATSVFKFNFEIHFSRHFPSGFHFVPHFLSTLFLSDPFNQSFNLTV